MNKRIMFVSTMSGFPWGGSEVLWSEAALCGLRRGHEVAAVTNEWMSIPEPVAKLAAAGVTCWVNPRPRSVPKNAVCRVAGKIARRLWPPAREAVAAIWKRVILWLPDFVCISQGGTYDSAYLLAMLLKAADVPYGVICQANCEYLIVTTEEHRERSLGYFSGARWVAFVADGNRRKTERELGARISNALVIKNPVNLTDRSLVPWPVARPMCFACVARLEAAAKGQDLLFEVLAMDCWRSRDWRLRLYGAGPDRAYLERINGMYLGDTHVGRVEFAGHVSDIRSVWAANHLLALPSRVEGTPLALVEAQLCGRPAVVTDVGGNGEWVTEPDNGFVAEAASVRSLAAAMERAWQARDRWPAMGERAHEEARRRIDPDAAGTLVDLIERSVDKERSVRKSSI